MGFHVSLRECRVAQTPLHRPWEYTSSLGSASRVPQVQWSLYTCVWRYHKLV